MLVMVQSDSPSALRGVFDANVLQNPDVPLTPRRTLYWSLYGAGVGGTIAAYMFAGKRPPRTKLGIGLACSLAVVCAYTGAALSGLYYNVNPR